MDKSHLKTAVISSGATAFIFIAFILGMKLMSTPTTPETAPAPESSQASATPIETQPAATLASADAIVDHLLSVEGRVQQALNYMKKASTNNKGGNVESSRNQLSQAVDNLSAAITYTKDHPEIANYPRPPATLDITAQFDVTHIGRRAIAPNLRSAMEELKPALAELDKTPGGDIGGFRDKILSNIHLASDDIAAGYSIASGRGPPPTPVTPPATKAAIGG